MDIIYEQKWPVPVLPKHNSEIIKEIVKEINAYRAIVDSIY